ncbi:MAG: hypothetical protein LUM44_23150 [Pyrinomonadaceae bacterium]|nr:hypothetical protein [Pyrinomonadaceae bacterium]
MLAKKDATLKASDILRGVFVAFSDGNLRGGFFPGFRGASPRAIFSVAFSDRYKNPKSKIQNLKSKVESCFLAGVFLPVW